MHRRLGTARACGGTLVVAVNFLGIEAVVPERVFAGRTSGESLCGLVQERGGRFLCGAQMRGRSIVPKL